jgi:8-oxo-dGTP pyrophosphatase MutT (NUDIX family)
MNLTKDLIASVLNSRQRTEVNLRDYPDFNTAAVLALMFPKSGKLHVLLTLRTHNVETHKGEISFPGGMVDEDDADATETALREAREEIGISTDKIEILGLLDDHITRPKFIITPVVAYLEHEPVCTPNPGDVESIFDVPLEFFFDPANARVEERVLPSAHGASLKRKVWFFAYRDYMIWGATAGMLMNLVERIKESPLSHSV